MSDKNLKNKGVKDSKNQAKTRVFISHGHSEIVCFKLKEFISNRLGMTPVVLQDESDLGMTIVKKLEHYGADCSFALIVLTADDSTVDGGKRARQNVIHELGFFHGKLGRKHVLLLRQKGVELFSNISGLIYKEFEETNIESIFEDIRKAIESDDASHYGQEIPKIPEANIKQALEKTVSIRNFVQRLDKDLDSKLHKNVLDERKVLEGLSAEEQLIRYKPILIRALEDVEKGIQKAEKSIEEFERRNPQDPLIDFRATNNLVSLKAKEYLKKERNALKRALVILEIYENSKESQKTEDVLRSIDDCFK